MRTAALGCAAVIGFALDQISALTQKALQILSQLVSHVRRCV